MKKKLESNEIKIDLLENGFDFILSALNYLSEYESARDLKYAILHLSSGFELIFKERLKNEHWSLLFERIDKVNLHDFETGNFVSVYFDSCLARLEGICGINFSDNEKEILRNFRDKRNKLEHFGIIDTVEALKSSAAKALSIALDFINKHLTEKEFSEAEIDLLDKLKKKMLEFDDFVDTRMKEIEARFKKHKGRLSVYACPSCLQKALLLGDDKPKCHFCGYQTEPEEAANAYLETIQGESHYTSVKEGGIYPLYICPECGRETLVGLNTEGEHKEEVGWVCFACGEEWYSSSLDICTSCGNPFVTQDEDFGICTSCLKNKIEKD